ncbi:hypothetical protein HDE_09191 [Halotydeus destructor]|nr:hypothetical protein HDE_09191 [Halotydeus destructor]
MLMALAISYFQVHSQHTTLPPIKSLNCQIKPSLKTPTKRRRQEQSAKFDEILKDFFYYIATFDYQNYGISILDGKIIVKPDHRQMYIENPFEHGHNITSGITKSELPGLITAAENAYVTLENVPEASLVDLLTPVNGSSGQNANRSSRIRSFKVGKRYNVGIKVDNFLREE